VLSQTTIAWHEDSSEAIRPNFLDLSVNASEVAATLGRSKHQNAPN
jgi:hypothetical protein